MAIFLLGSVINRTDGRALIPAREQKFPPLEPLHFCPAAKIDY